MIRNAHKNQKKNQPNRLTGRKNRPNNDQKRSQLFCGIVFRFHTLTLTLGHGHTDTRTLIG